VCFFIPSKYEITFLLLAHENEMDPLSLFKWRILSQTTKIGSGKNKKIFIFPTGLEDHLEDMYSVFQKVKFTTLGRQFQFKFYDFWWSSLDIIDDASSEASYNFVLETLVHFYNFEVSYFEIHTPHAHYPIDIHHHTSIDHFLGDNQHKILHYGFHSLLSLKKEH
jgi:hypothetical protein